MARRADEETLGLRQRGRAVAGPGLEAETGGGDAGDSRESTTETRYGDKVRRQGTETREGGYFLINSAFCASDRLIRLVTSEYSFLNTSSDI